MASSLSNKEAPGDLSDIKRKLAWRMGFAGLMIVALLGGLALFDYVSAPSAPESGAPQFTEPVPVPKKVLTQPVTSTEPALESVGGEQNSTTPESTAAPVDKSVPVTEPPPRPEVAAQPVLPRESRSPARTVAPSGQTLPAVPLKPAESRAAISNTAPTDTTQPLLPPVPARLFSGYALQAGVFADPRRAEELHAKLMLEGIPSTIEARVQVGPFKSRKEAEAARVKMKALGIETVMLLPKGAKR